VNEREKVGERRKSEREKERASEKDSGMEDGMDRWREGEEQGVCWVRGGGRENVRVRE